MEFESLSKGLALIKVVIDTLKAAISLVPSNDAKVALKEKVALAERELKIAEAATASQLGYRICRNHFPPAVMLSSDDKHWECPECNNRWDRIENNKHPWSGNSNF